MTLDVALPIILSNEGGYSDDADDPGGKTMHGITERVARENGYHGAMQDMPIQIAANIYRVRYWDAARCDEYPWPLSLFVFDAAVNQGVLPAVKMLQATLSTVQDGIVGQTTKRLAKESTSWHWALYLATRAQRYQGTRNYDKFGRGWMTRLFVLAMAGK